jgi:PAS domain S-box-containing protein
MMQASSLILLIILGLLLLPTLSHPMLQRIVTVCIFALLAGLAVIINRRTSEMKLTEHRLLRLTEELRKTNTDLRQNVAVRRDIEEALRKSEHHLRAVLESLQAGVVIIDAERREIVDVNPAALALIGAPKEKVLGSVCHGFLCPADAGNCPITDLGESIDHSERVLLNARGEKIPILKTVVEFETNNRRHLLESFIDITDLKQTQEDLRTAKNSAEAASLAKSQFLANMSHETRTPMNGVLGMIELLLGTPLTETQRHFARTAHRSGQALLNLLDDILDFSRIEAGRLKLESSDFDLSQVAEEVVDLLAPEAHGKGLEISCMLCHDADLALRGDPGRLRQILTNMIGNAVKFTEHGGVVLSVSVAEETPDEALIHFAVQDSGVGIARHQREHIFEVFTQADGTSTRRHGGTGLGLSIVKGLVTMMGGELGCQSTPGEGSTFWFTARFEKQPGSPTAVLPLLPAFEGRRVLVIDNNETTRGVLSRYLASWGIKADGAADAAQALLRIRAAAFRGTPYDVAFLALPLTVVEGVVSEQEICHSLDVAGTRQVILTLLGTEHVSDEKQDLNMCLLSKPVRRPALYNCLKGILTSQDEHDDRPPERAINDSEPQGHVLLAEDSPVNQAVTCSMLEVLGFDATVVWNGQEALEALSASAYSAVLMDCQMPVMDGLAATQAIRDREYSLRLQRTPIIAVTANAFPSDREQCLAAGMDDYLSKPFTLEQLRAVLNRWVPETAAASTERDFTTYGASR